MRHSLSRLMLAAALICLASGSAFAQGSTTSSMAGTVVDSGGGVIPGATVVVKNTSTGTTTSAISNASGAFNIPALEPGKYTVTVSLSGFRSAVLNDVTLAIGTPQTIKATLEVGNVAETVEVKGGVELVNTQTATVSSTLNVDQINKMPMATRNALNAVTFLPGVNTAGVNRDSNFNGLPDSFVAISLDGVNNNENFNKSTEGLFAMVTPRPDAVEAVTVTTAGAGADVGGHGAVQVAFQTRSGTNRFTGSAYHYHRSPGLNTNFFFNEINGLAKNDVVLNQYGFRQGGPIVIPKLYDGRGKAFFFFNYEELRLPNDFTRTRYVLQPQAQSGIFSWDAVENGQTVVRTRDVLALAASNGQIASYDPTVLQVLNNIRAATQSQGVVNNVGDFNTNSYLWLSPGDQTEKQPVVKIDYNLNAQNRISATYNWQVVIRDPDHLNSADVRFPGFDNFRKYTSYRPLSSGSLRSTLTPNLVNELRGGIKWGPSYFGEDASNGPQTFDAQGGHNLTFPQISASNNQALTNAGNQNTPTARSAWSWNIDNTLNWQHGSHSLSFGTSLFFGNVWADNQQMVPTIGFGVDTNDPAFAMFSTANFPGASDDERANARGLYALLTGRVNSIGGNLVLDEATKQYVYLGKRRQAGRMNEYSFFAQDSWRMTPRLTLNAGLRWDIQMPFQAVNDVMSQATFADACGISGIGPDGQCNFFQPAANSGVFPQFIPYTSGSKGWNTDWNNVAPNVGVAWLPHVETGFLRTILGDPEQATVRGGYSVNYAREGMARFTGVYGANPGSQVSVTRNAGTNLLIPPGESYPVLLRQPERLGPPPFNQIPAISCDASGVCAPAYPIRARANRQDGMNIFHPDIQVAYARSYTVSFQRALSRDMAVDVRYVGTRGVNQWTDENYNEINIIENGFYNEFLRAMGNLQANQAAGLGNTFAYTGAAGTTPLPIYLAYFNGSRDVNNPGAYSGNNWTNSTFVGRLARQRPQPYDAAGDLDGNATRRGNAANAGMPANLFVVNPDVSTSGNDNNIWTSDAYSSYDALQIELRRRLSRGLQITGSYQYALEYGSVNLGKHWGRVSEPTDNVRHAFKLQWDWMVPVGRGRRFGTDMSAWMDALVGGWGFNGAGRIQANTVDFGGVRLVGMTVDELTKEYRHRYNPETKIVTMLPDDIILNTRRAFSPDATSATGYGSLGPPEGRYIAPDNSADCTEIKNGDCAPRTLLIRAPWFTRFDISLSKRFETGSRVNFELRIDVLNVFDNINFDNASNPGGGATIFQVDDAYRDPSNTFDPGGRLGQIVWRINW
jgi:Carboxypeptidase regulatory-like domain/TonB-dependent Receptor Plug Domain